MTHRELTILRKTTLEMKFVSIKLIPGTLCFLSVLMSMITFDEDSFPNPNFENLIIFVTCYLLNALMVAFYIYGYDIEKFDFERYATFYEEVLFNYKSVKNTENKLKNR